MTPADRSPVVVLVADPHADMREYVATSLRACGPVQVLEAADGLEALHLARGIQPSLVIAAHPMPGLSTAVLCRTLRDQPKTRLIPVLIISDDARPTDAHDDQGLSEATLGDADLGKPFNAARLQAAVERLLGRPIAPH